MSWQQVLPELQDGPPPIGSQSDGHTLSFRLQNPPASGPSEQQTSPSPAASAPPASNGRATEEQVDVLGGMHATGHGSHPLLAVPQLHSIVPPQLSGKEMQANDGLAVLTSRHVVHPELDPLWPEVELPPEPLPPELLPPEPLLPEPLPPEPLLPEPLLPEPLPPPMDAATAQNVLPEQTLTLGATHVWYVGVEPAGQSLMAEASRAPPAPLPPPALPPPEPVQVACRVHTPLCVPVAGWMQQPTPAASLQSDAAVQAAPTAPAPLPPPPDPWPWPPSVPVPLAPPELPQCTSAAPARNAASIEPGIKSERMGKSLSFSRYRRAASPQASRHATRLCDRAFVGVDSRAGGPPMSLPEKFEDAQKRVNALKSRPSNDELLDLYALYKQATVGDATGKRPGMLDLKGRAKFDAWEGRKGTSKDKAMEAYVALVDRLAGA